MTIERITIWYAKLKALLDEKEQNEYLVNHQVVRNVLIEILNDMEKVLN